MNHRHCFFLPRALIFFLFIGIILSCAAPLSAKPLLGSRPPKSPNLIKELNLTKAQVTLVNAQRIELEKRQLKLRAELQDKQLDLKAELRKEVPDLSLVNSLVDAIGKTEAEKVRSRVENLLKLKSILTPEQKEKLLSYGMFGVL
jgi:Spy/CpxP family protein refolding chaperone